jgi:putative lipase involved disintegration of autophagic bodies
LPHEVGLPGEAYVFWHAGLGHHQADRVVCTGSREAISRCPIASNAFDSFHQTGDSAEYAVLENPDQGNQDLHVTALLTYIGTALSED